MELSYEYNEYVIGYVVTDEDTGRSCNFQFEHDRNVDYNPIDQRHFVAYGCEGDDTHSEFNEDELNEMLEWLSSHDEVKNAEKIVTAAHETDELHEAYEQLCMESGNGVYISDIEGLLSKA